ncbi:T9SS type B sorting domain-containing protein, partial [Chitinophaga arvensicola]
VKAYLIRNEPGALTFQYIVKKGDLDGTGISINPVLQVNDSKPADATGNAINTAMNHVPATTAILVDGIPPTVTRITQLDPPVTKATKVRYAIIFSEAVRGFTAADVSVNKTGSMQAPVVSLAYPATDSIVVTADNINGAGTLLLSIHQTAAATDLAGNPLEASPLTSTYTIDNQKPGNTAPTVADIPDASLCADVAVHTIVVGGISAGIETDQAITAAVVADKSFFSSLTVVNNNDGTVTIRYELKARASGDVRITLTIADNGGTENGGVDRVSKSFVLSVKPMPILPIIVTPEHDIPQGAQAVLTTSGAATYLWKDEPGIVSGKNTAILVVQPMETTTYIVTGTTSEGCIASAATTIRVDVPAKFEATNVLTPNGDGINDRWVIKNISRYPNNQVKIFDRSGRLIYTKSGYNNEWDGTLNGQVLAQDTYYYIVDLGEGGKLEKGFITILRNRK